MAHERSEQAGDELGPVDHLVVEFPNGVTDFDGFAVLLDLAERGVIYVLDLEFVERAVGGEVRVVDLCSLPNPQGVDLSALEGSSTGLLDADDIHAVGRTLQPGGVAAVLVYENLFAEALASALGRSGGRVVSRNSVSVDDLSTAFDRGEADEARA